MPQPVHHRELISFDFSPEAVLQRPALAQRIAAISALWNEIDTRIAALLAALLGGEAKTGISIYFAITNDGAKRAALEAICTMKLSTDEQTRLRAVLKTIGERYADRNHAIHGVWGVSPRYPDKLLWADARDMVLLHVEMIALPGPENHAQRQQLQIVHQRTMMVWSERDFLDTEKRLRDAYQELHAFSKPFIDQALASGGLRSTRLGP